jgi:UDP-N-acetylmuramoylalanine--D-glutamate ligase
MGLGRFGGGVGVARWLAGQGASVLVTDLLDADALREPLETLGDLVRESRIRLRLGGHETDDFTSSDLLVANPAVPKPWTNRYLQSARRAGVRITTEIRLLVERLDRRQVIGVTGTAGKSTSAAMIHHVLERATSRSWLGGNIGGSLLETLDTIAPDDLVVLELSSAMLHWLAEGAGSPDHRGWSPRFACLTNLASNHLDWHGSFEHYRNAKEGIFRYQAAGDVAVRGDDLDGGTEQLVLAVPGSHNQRNARLAAAAAAAATGMDRAEAGRLLADFAGLPHRLQRVADRGGRTIYNDSKSTTPQATCLAVAAFESPARVHLIAGGYDKGVDLSAIAKLAPTLAGLYTIGTTGPGLAKAGHAVSCETLERAVEVAFQNMRDGDVLLLSPGCASWDQFVNYEARGNRFSDLVRSYS